MIRKMKALVYHGVKNLVVEEVNIPKINDDELLVKVNLAGVCGTDVRIYNGSKKITPPRITGHEFVGSLVEVGKNITGYEIGDLITVYPMIPCGECYCCRQNQKNICVNRKTIGYEIDGGFAEFVKIPREALEQGNVIKLPLDIELIEAALSEPLTAAYHGIKRLNLKSGESLAIFGAGFIGMCHIQLARLADVSKIIVVEPQEDKGKIAKNLGADLVIHPNEQDEQAGIHYHTNGDGVDAAIVDVGIPSAIEKALYCLKKGGKLLLFAGCPEGSKITIDPNWIHYREIDVTGSSAAIPKEQQEVLEMIANRQIDVKRFLTQVVPLEDWKKVFGMKENYLGFKSLIKFE